MEKYATYSLLSRSKYKLMIVRQYVSLVKLSFLNSTYNIMSSTGAGKSVKRKKWYSRNAF